MVDIQLNDIVIKLCEWENFFEVLPFFSCLKIWNFNFFYISLHCKRLKVDRFLHTFDNKD